MCVCVSEKAHLREKRILAHHAPCMQHVVGGHVGVACRHIRPSAVEAILTQTTKTRQQINGFMRIRNISFFVVRLP